MSGDRANYLGGLNQRQMKPMVTMADMMREFVPEVDADHHHSEGYRQAMNEAIELINRPDLKNRREIIAVLEARRDLVINSDQTGSGK